MAAPPNRTLVVIPSRWASRRLAGKPLAELDGEPMVWHVVQRAREAAVGEVVVATDDERILEAVRTRGAAAMMTSPGWRNGSERVAEVARSRPDADLVIDLQGDEPLMDPGVLVALDAHLRDRP
ncbi:MAG: NTP transferase domain-containing protein, partial [Myxococcota bacterium]|nr:NTP transferase domain-containing protein [Myxococcota bacterium]